VHAVRAQHIFRRKGLGPRRKLRSDSTYTRSSVGEPLRGSTALTLVPPSISFRVVRGRLRRHASPVFAAVGRFRPQRHKPHQKPVRSELRALWRLFFYRQARLGIDGFETSQLVFRSRSHVNEHGALPCG
jgi:hypothetical protein